MAALVGTQRGQVTILGGADNATASLSPAINLSRSILFFTWKGGSNRVNESAVTGTKTSTTLLTFNRDAAPASVTVVIEWVLFEFDDKVDVQDETITTSSFSVTAAINAVELARSFILCNGFRGGAGSASALDFSSVKFNSNVEIQADTGSSPPGNICNYQVVDYIGCAVDEVLHSITGFTGTETLDTFPAVGDIANAMILCSTELVTSNFRFDTSSFRVDLSADNTARFLRNGTQIESYNFQYFVVEFTDGTSVQAGLHTLAGGDLTDPITINPVTILKSWPFLGNSMNWESCGEIPDVSHKWQEFFLLCELTAVGTFTVSRIASSDPTMMAWDVVEWSSGIATKLAPPDIVDAPPRRFKVDAPPRRFKVDAA